ncbi:MAG: protein kinase domain-containing protein [Pyrinomonadaceae bacterium]
MVGEKISHYKILEKLGSGGQGTVYKARDTKLDRLVVIKVLPPELTAKKANFARFEREAKLASQLDHPNICTIYDYGEDSGTFYIAMQYVEGKTVRELVDGKPLEQSSAIKIEIQVCDALAYAHSKKIIHRDIKAGNVMVRSDGQVKILDFGLAKLLQEEHPNAPDVQMDLTEIGIPYGTATYAAPEQAKGDPTDHRADIFSSGVLLYEMLTGIWAFQGKTVIDVRHQVLYGTPVPLDEMRGEPVHPRLQQIVDRALAKDPKDRFQKIGEMRDELKLVLKEITGDAVVPGETFSPRHMESDNAVKRAWNWLKGKGNTDPQTSMHNSTGYSTTYAPDVTLTTTGKEKRIIAILPFTNVNKDSAADFYEFALADSVITELAHFRSLVVRPSSVIAKYQGKDVDPRTVGRELRAHAVLSASFLKAGDRIRVTAQLLDVITGEIIWSDRIDAAGEDILAVQDTIAQSILDGLRVELSDEEQEKLAKRPTQSAEAYEEFLRGRDNFGRFIFQTVSAEDCEAAIQNFTRAIELDNEFGLAYSGLGACFANRVFKGIGDADDYTLAEAAFNKALRFDPNIIEARVLMVMIYLARDEKERAREEVNKLHAEYPNEPPIYFVRGVIRRLDGKYEDSLLSFQKLSRLDPAAVIVASYNRARIYIYQGEFELAISELDKGAKAEPNHPLIKFFRSKAYFHHGDVEKAIEIIEEVLKTNPEMDGVRTMYALYLAKQGDEKNARAQLTERALDIARTDHDIAYWTTGAYSLLGDVESAVKWFERAIKLGNENKAWFEKDTSLDPIRNDPHFVELLGSI